MSSSVLQSLLTASLNRKQAHGHESSQHQSPGGVDGRVDVAAATVDGDQRGTQSRDSVKATGNSGTSTAVRGGEDFRRIGVEYAVHDVLEEGFQGRADKLDVRVGGGRKAEEKNTGDHGGNDHGTLATDVLDVDGVAGENGSGDTDDGSDGVVPVDNVGGLLGRTASALDVLGKEGVEKRVTHADGSPAEPQKNGCKSF